jgi:hypothetical protein
MVTTSLLPKPFAVSQAIQRDFSRAEKMTMKCGIFATSYATLFTTLLFFIELLLRQIKSCTCQSSECSI